MMRLYATLQASATIFLILWPEIIKSVFLVMVVVLARFQCILGNISMLLLRRVPVPTFTFTPTLNTNCIEYYEKVLKGRIPIQISHLMESSSPQWDPLRISRFASGTGNRKAFYWKQKPSPKKFIEFSFRIITIISWGLRGWPMLSFGKLPGHLLDWSWRVRLGSMAKLSCQMFTRTINSLMARCFRAQSMVDWSCGKVILLNRWSGSLNRRHAMLGVLRWFSYSMIRSYRLDRMGSSNFGNSARSINRKEMTNWITTWIRRKKSNWIPIRETPRF